MTSDTPQGDPRLQRISPGPQVATGYVDPCIVYLETTLPGEIPLVVACWARSSMEIQEPGHPVRMELRDVVVFQGKRQPRLYGREGWVLSARRETSIILKHRLGDGMPDFPHFSSLKLNTAPVFQWAIRFLDRETDDLLQAKCDSSLSPNSRHVPITQQVFELAKLDWPSIVEIIEFSKEKKTPRSRRPSFVRRLVSAVFAKKPRHAPA